MYYLHICPAVNIAIFTKKNASLNMQISRCSKIMEALHQNVIRHFANLFRAPILCRWIQKYKTDYLFANFIIYMGGVILAAPATDVWLFSSRNNKPGRPSTKKIHWMRVFFLVDNLYVVSCHFHKQGLWTFLQFVYSNTVKADSFIKFQSVSTPLIYSTIYRIGNQQFFRLGMYRYVTFFIPTYISYG